MRIYPLFTLFLLLAAPAMAQDLLIGTTKFNITLATTPEQQEKGLMNRKDIKANEGMLFLMESPRPMRMWMKDTPTSLDMLFIDENGKILHIEENTEPNSTDIISYDGNVKAVLEILGGASAKSGIKVGDVVKHPAFGK